ncbi:MAG: heparinase II/III family protein [Verrucomicrobiota bacterium]
MSGLGHSPSSGLSWYWHRLQAMSAGEICRHFTKKLHQWQDRRRLPNWPGATARLESPRQFPSLPDPNKAPVDLLEAIRQECDQILRGRWMAFRRTELAVEDPPRWHKDYLAGVDLETQALAFDLNHRQLPNGADVKLIWELSRWYPLVRLAQGSYLLQDKACAAKCLEWLGDWGRHNPPFRGWNWTSALEAGIRLTQFTWIDALLSNSLPGSATLDRLRQELLAPHVWFTWRYRSFGSSANNHLIGELAGLAVALARWPELERSAASLEFIARLWETEVLAQFAEDGGNREQALNYQLFSWELCWLTERALAAAGIPVSNEVQNRLAHAANFFVAAQVPDEPWDYGDSDDAFVLPVFRSTRTLIGEWQRWFRDAASSPAIAYWFGDPPRPVPHPRTQSAAGWTIFPDSGLAMQRLDGWTLRWDLSPLGYLSTAAHGHLDALHLSLWLHGQALLIDPGTGAYYGDRVLRARLAGWPAHNGPHLEEIDFPSRLGPFLWSAHHARPVWNANAGDSLTAELELPGFKVQRTIRRVNYGWQIDDQTLPQRTLPNAKVKVHWHFAPDCVVQPIDRNTFRVVRDRLSIDVQIEGWDEMEIEPNRICSPGFRQTAASPALKLAAPANKACVLRTTFLASHAP